MRRIIIILHIVFLLFSIKVDAQLNGEIRKYSLRTELGFINDRDYTEDKVIVTFITFDGTFLISANSVFINRWNLKTGEYKQILLDDKFKGSREIKFSADGNHMAFSKKGYIYTIDANTGKTVYTLSVGKNKDHFSRSFSFSPNGKWLVINPFDEMLIVNLSDYSAKREPGHYQYVTNTTIFLRYSGKLYKTSISNPETYTKIKGSNDYGIFGIDSQEEKAWFAKRKGYVHTYWYTYEERSDGSKRLIKGEIEKIQKLDYHVNDLILTSSTYENGYYNYIAKKTGRIYRTKHKITNNDYFISAEDYYMKIKNIQNPKEDMSLYQDINGNWIIVKDNYFDCSVEWLGNSNLAHLITDHYIPELVAENREHNNDIFTDKKLVAFTNSVVGSDDKTNLKKWFLPDLNDSVYNQKMEDFLSKNSKTVFFQNKNWYGNMEKLLRIENDIIHVAFIEKNLNDSYEGFYMIEDSLCIKGRIKNGFLIEGKYYYSDAYHEGKFQDNKLSGKGKIISFKGDTLSGFFKEGEINGEGTMKYANGDIYSGNFKNGLINGNGNYKYASGSEYIGEFKDGKYHGEGKWYYDNGELYYEGLFVKGKIHGEGKEYYSDGSPTYDGEFKEGERHGNGIVWVDGEPEKAEYYKDERIDQAYIIRKENEELKRNVTPDYVYVWLEVIGRIPASIYLYYPNQKGGEIYGIRSHNEKISVPRNTKIGYKDKIILTATEEINFTTVYNSK